MEQLTAMGGQGPTAVGVVLPQTEIGNDPGAIRAYAEATEDMGYTHLLALAGRARTRIGTRSTSRWCCSDSWRASRDGSGSRAGRDPGTFGIEGRITLARVPRENWKEEFEAWRAMRGITHLSISTMGLGLEKPDQHVALLRGVREMAR